jgi:RNA polymerase sigma factor for flagellar operon FliA
MTEPLTLAVLPRDFAQRIARSYARRLPPYVCMDDLLSAGHQGLAEAMTRFDPTRAEGFIAYAELRIRGAMKDELRSRDTLSRDQRRQARQLAEATRVASARLGRPADAAEIATELGVSLETYWERRATVTIDGARGDDDADPIARLPDPRAALADDQVARQQMTRSVDRAIRSLPARMQRILELHYVDGLKLREIGETLGVSESRVCQIVREALARVRTLCTDHCPEAALAA